MWWRCASTPVRTPDRERAGGSPLAVSLWLSHPAQSLFDTGWEGIESWTVVENFVPRSLRLDIHVSAGARTGLFGEAGHDE